MKPLLLTISLLCCLSISLSAQQTAGSKQEEATICYDERRCHCKDKACDPVFIVKKSFRRNGYTYLVSYDKKMQELGRKRYTDKIISYEIAHNIIIVKERFRTFGYPYLVTYDLKFNELGRTALYK